MVYTTGLMPRQRFLNLAPEARARLLDVATKHFAQRGFEAASLNEILAEVGISKGAYYYYFEDKEDLFATALEGALDAMLASQSIPQVDTLTRERFWPTVEGFVMSWTEVFDTSSDIFQVAAQFTEAQRRNPRFAPIIAKAQAMYRMLIETGQRVGCIRTDVPIDVLVRLVEANDAALDGIFASRHPKVTRANVDEHVKLVFDTLKRLLIVNTSSKERSKKRKRRG